MEHVVKSWKISLAHPVILGALALSGPTCFFACLRSVNPQWATPSFRANSNRTSVVKHKRQVYARLYPLRLVRTDGSTITIRYPEPKRIVMVCIGCCTEFVGAAKEMQIFTKEDSAEFTQ
uniref:Uncharacterized protein n=1 Tax=Eptatretus burgeri TaxID=7764 RepID=A0A8C4PWC3_EPTBU